MLIALALATSGSVGAVAASASGPTATPPPNAPAQEKQLFATCRATVTSMEKALKAAPSTHVRVIRSQLQVSTPGTLTAKLAFNRSAVRIMFGVERPRAHAAVVTTSTTYDCGAAATNRPGLGPGRTRVVATLTRTFTTPGLYRLTFRLNAVGRRLLAQLAKADQNYARQYPNGEHPPTIAVGVSLTYATSG